MWRGGGRVGLSVSAPFVWRCLNSRAIAPFPHPSHRTGLADLSGRSAIAGFHPHRSRRAALPHRALLEGDLRSGQGTVPGLMDDGARERVDPQKFVEPLPGHPRLLAATPKRREPGAFDAVVEGVQVVDVERGSLASQMGLRKHDFVETVNGQQVRDLDEFGAAMRKLGGGPGLVLGLRRDRQRGHMIAC